MSPVMTFHSTKESLLNMLDNIAEGKIQLPDFQRGWVWDDEHIKSLIASVSLSYPIGAVMMLETGNENVRFKPRLLEGVAQTQSVIPEKFILDGQQRLTALFQSLRSRQAVETRDARGKPLKRRYYIDIQKAISVHNDREEAIVGLPEDRLVRNFRGEVIADYSTTENECAADLFPLLLIFDGLGHLKWQMRYVTTDPARFQRWSTFHENIIQPIQQYQVPLILLTKETPKEAVCQVFEKVNTGGVALTVFELLTATFAADDFNLREDWFQRKKRFQQHKVLLSLENTHFLQAIALLATYKKKMQYSDAAISCKRKDILQLSLEDYKTWADAATRGFEEAAKILHAQKVFSARDLPYQTQLVPLAAIFALVGKQAEIYEVKAKLARWYWCGVFGELYGSAVETRFAKDVPEVLRWIAGGIYPSTIDDANFVPARLLTLRSRNSAAYKGLYALLLRDGGMDLGSGTSIDVQMYFDDKIDVHHIFPQDWCRKHDIAAGQCDSIVNKTAISARTNRMVGGRAPSVYLAQLQKNAGIDDKKMAEILSSHVIEATYLYTDDFSLFFKARQAALLHRIEQVMGKPIAGGIPQEELLALANGENEYQSEEIDSYI